MNEYVSASLYGIIQGITEFLPVSSSGHLALIPFFTGESDPGVVFDLAMHVGTAFAVMLAFRSELIKLLRQTLGLLKGEFAPFAVNYWSATFVTIILAFAFKDFAEAYARHPVVIAFNLVFFGALMFVADRYGKSGISLQTKIDWQRSLLMGVAQAMAVFPGVSRSGATLTAGRYSQMSRDEAGSFSFMLSLPIILGGFVYKLLELKMGHEPVSFNYSMMLTGVVIAFIIGFATIKFFMAMLKKFSLGIYFWYRLILAAVVLGLFYRA